MQLLNYRVNIIRHPAVKNKVTAIFLPIILQTHIEHVAVEARKPLVHGFSVTRSALPPVREQSLPMRWRRQKVRTAVCFSQDLKGSLPGLDKATEA